MHVKKIRVHIYIDLENIQDAWVFIKHLKGKHQKSYYCKFKCSKNQTGSTAT